MVHDESIYPQSVFGSDQQQVCRRLPRPGLPVRGTWPLPSSIPLHSHSAHFRNRCQPTERTRHLRQILEQVHFGHVLKQSASAEESPYFLRSHHVKKGEGGYLFTSRQCQILFVNFGGAEASVNFIRKRCGSGARCIFSATCGRQCPRAR
jgi:hypothetical protein